MEQVTQSTGFTETPAGRFQLPRAFAALAYRNYRLYFTGQMISLAGTWMQIIAQGWLVYQISGSEWTLGLVGFASALPNLFVAPWGGVVADRVSKRHLLMATQGAAMVLAFILAALTLTGVVEVWHLITLAALTGVVQAFDAPARQAFTVEMVDRSNLQNAIALNSMTFNGARVIGPALGGILLAVVGAGWCFLFNAISFFAVLTSLGRMDLPRFEKAVQTVSPWQSLKSGLAYTWRTREILGLILLALAFSVFGIAYQAVLPAFVDKVLGAGATAYGNLNAAQGLGAVTGAFIVGQLGDRLARGRVVLIVGLLFPLVLALFAFNPVFIVSLLLAYIMGIGFMLHFTTMNTLLQLLVVDDMRGRVLGLYTLTFFGFAPFGNLLLGWLSEQIGLSTALAIFAVIAFALIALIHARVPQLRRLR